jgi:hypothetical protein
MRYVVMSVAGQVSPKYARRCGTRQRAMLMRELMDVVFLEEASINVCKVTTVTGER